MSSCSRRAVSQRAETGNILVRCYSSMLRHATRVAAPAFFSLTRSGEVRQLKTGL